MGFWCQLFGCECPTGQRMKVADTLATITATGTLISGRPGTVIVIRHIALAGTGGGSVTLTARIGGQTGPIAGVVAGYLNTPCEVRIDEGQGVTATISVTGYATILYYEVMP